uniref:Chromosome X open reading frame 65 n=1 Tax=Pavo cristatus TaxID=9049 RepID=A0A8C9EZK5_PAVCR
PSPAPRHGYNQSFLANTDCPVLLLLSHLRSKVGVPPSETIDLCDKLGSPKMLFQVKTMQDRASDFLPARGTYYVCRVEFGAPGTCREQTAQSFVPLLKNPSVALTGGCGDGNAEQRPRPLPVRAAAVPGSAVPAAGTGRGGRGWTGRDESERSGRGSAGSGQRAASIGTAALGAGSP